MENKEILSLEEVFVLQPAIKRLYEATASIKDTGEFDSFCANEIWYGLIKPRLSDLVGWYAKTNNELLKSSEAYDVSYEMIYGRLPNCRLCSCL